MPEGTVIGVLIVDDDARVCRALRELLEVTDGMTFAGCARDAGAALIADEQLTPSVALVDMLLPTCADGVGVIRQLLARGRPVVAMSVSAATREAAVAAGAVAFVEKGPDFFPLLAALQDSSAAFRAALESAPERSSLRPHGCPP